ncbi:helix-turn-helix domain-containing protein [Desulfomicrobium norvegicum]|uniref:helix-turn-helix domain-containing protein n=1 Tax=Desulfomicrobium norvegicum (strain DSM 1741 / NCIMB 8310) TaxID=52561 RepID=UPI0031343359
MHGKDYQNLKIVNGVIMSMYNDKGNSKNALCEKDAAKYLELSVHTLRQRRFRSLPPVYVKIGRSVRYLLSDLDTFIGDSRVEH